MDITIDDLKAAINHYKGPATLSEVCRLLNITKSWDRECIRSRLCNPKHFTKIPIRHLDRDYNTLNVGTTKWAYKIIAPQTDQIQ